MAVLKKAVIDEQGKTQALEVSRNRVSGSPIAHALQVDCTGCFLGMETTLLTFDVYRSLSKIRISRTANVAKK